MAEINTTSTKLSDGLINLTSPAYTVKAMLQGAIAMLSQCTAYQDPSGHIWASLQLIEDASKQVDELYGDRETDLLSRLRDLDEAVIY